MGGMTLRPYQQEAFEHVFEQWDGGTHKTLVVMPTGTGKTIVFAKIVEECVRRGCRVLIMAHRGELLDQAADKILKSTGLKCSVEKAGQTCLGEWYRVVVGSVQTLMHERRLKKFKIMLCIGDYRSSKDRQQLGEQSIIFSRTFCTSCIISSTTK